MRVNCYLPHDFSSKILSKHIILHIYSSLNRPFRVTVNIICLRGLTNDLIDALTLLCKIHFRVSNRLIHALLIYTLYLTIPSTNYGHNYPLDFNNTSVTSEFVQH